jgi:catechol 2,3-dioxygenase-like lactoylglutathione lyase family enzyme
MHGTIRHRSEHGCIGEAARGFPAEGPLDSVRSVTVELFAGLPVADYARAVDWYERLLGAPPAFLPNDVEAVWEVGEHRYVFVEVRPQHAGHSMHTLFVDDLEERVRAISGRGIEPAERETYSNGVRKVTYRDPDGNEIGFGGPPLE